MHGFSPYKEGSHSAVILLINYISARIRSVIKLTVRSNFIQFQALVVKQKLLTITSQQ